MEQSDEKKREFTKRLLMSRMRLLTSHGFYGLLLMHMRFALSDSLTETACTNGMQIWFNPGFLDSLSDSELDFVMMHELLHVVLQHCTRTGDRQPEQFNIACDIVVNSNILLENKMDPRSITLSQWGESMHTAPDGKEGYEYTAEQVYGMLTPPKKSKPKKGSGSQPGDDGNSGDSQGGMDVDIDTKGGNSNDPGSIGGGTPRSQMGRAKKVQDKGTPGDATWDDHTQWGMLEEDDTLRDVWVKRTIDAAEAITIRDPSNTRGLLPMFAQRLLEDLKKPQIDWRTILNEFIQEEVVDYSFTPPDRRFDDGDFFLPDFNEKDDMVEDILFMIDTSGSMSDKMITAAYSEVKGAIDQFGGKLKGWLGFFDAAIIEPQPFTDADEFKVIQPAGGGGTDFQIIFEYVQQYMQDKLPASIIILTDGYAPFPKEHLAMGIPVLWLLNNENVTPPWGKIARIQV